MKLAGMNVPTFYGYIKEEVKVASPQTITESYWEAIPLEDKGIYNGEKHVLVVEMGLLKIAPVQVMNMFPSQKAVKVPTMMTDMKSKEKSKKDGEPKSTELKHLSDTPSTKDGKIADTEAKASETVTPVTKMTDMKSAEKSKTDGAPKKTELKTMESLPADGGDPEKTAATVIKDVKSGNRKTDTTGVVKEDLEDMEDEGDEDESEVSCDECGGTFAGKKMKTIATCDQHKGMSKVGGEPEEDAEDEEEEDAMQESAEEVAKRIIAAVHSGKRITDTSEVEIDSNTEAPKYKSKLADYMPKSGKIADTEAKKATNVTAPTKMTDMKSKEKAKTDGAPKKTELKSDTPDQVEESLDDSKKKSEIAEETIADHEKNHVTDGEGRHVGYVHSDKYGADRNKRWHAWSSTGARQGYLDGIHGSRQDAVRALKTHHGIAEAWDTDYETPKSKRGMFANTSNKEAHAELAKLKASGPHKEGSPEHKRELELEFDLRAKHGFKGVDEATAFDAAKRIIAQVMAHNPPHEAPAIDDAKQTKNDGFDYNKLIDKETQVDATRKDGAAELAAIADKRGEKYLDSKVPTPSKVMSQVNQRLKELQDSKEEYGDWSGSDGKQNAVAFLEKVKELLSQGSVDGFQQAQVAWTQLASQIRDMLPSALVNFLATGRNTMKDNGGKPEEV